MSHIEDMPVTLGMLIRAIEASQEFIIVEGGGGNGYDSSVAVVVADELIDALRQAVKCQEP